MSDRHAAFDGLLGQRYHFPLPRLRSSGQEIHAEGVKPFPVPFLILVGKHIVHQTADHGGLGFLETGALELFQNHTVPLNASMVRRIDWSVRFTSSRLSALPVARISVK